MTSWVGVDVGGKKKRFDVALVDDRRVLALQGHLSCHEVIDLIAIHKPAVVAIDSPRSYALDGETTRPGERLIAATICGIRWTPDYEHVRASPYYAWILEGQDLYERLAASEVEVIEVFPTASWTRWHGKRGAQTRASWSRQALAALDLDCVPARTNQDQRDAIAAAVTAREHCLRKTEKIGEIVVPAAPS